MILILFSCGKLGEKSRFPELGQCILHIYERRKIFGGGGIELSTEGYSKLAIKSQQSAPLSGVEPGTSCT